MLVFSSIDFRSFSVNKYCLLILLTGGIQSVSTLLVGYLILQISAFSFILSTNVFATLLSILYMFLFARSELWKMPQKTTNKMLTVLSLNNFLWLISYVITLHLIKELGIVTTSLLGMFTMVLTIVSGYIFFRDVPSRKGVAVATIIVVCIM